VYSTVVGVSLPWSTGSNTQGPTTAATGALVATTTPTSASQSTTSSSSNSGSGSGGLSVGDIAGIAGAVIGAIGVILTALGYFFPKQRKDSFNAIRRGFGYPPNTTRSHTQYESLSPGGYSQQSFPTVR
jgi:hypothetical protein